MTKLLKLGMLKATSNNTENKNAVTLVFMNYLCNTKNGVHVYVSLKHDTHLCKLIIKFPTECTSFFCDFLTNVGSKATSYQNFYKN